MAGNNEKTLKEAIEELLTVYKLKDKLLQTRLINSWEKVMGKSVANRTGEIYISGKKLFVKISSAALREELSYSREKILTLLNESAGAKVIDEVVLL